LYFPPTIQLIGNYGYKLRRLTIINGYVGIGNGWGLTSAAGPDIYTYGIYSGTGFVEDVYLGTFYMGMATDHSADVMHSHGIHIWPFYDFYGANQTTAHGYETSLDPWVLANGTGLAFYRADQSQLLDIFIFGKKTGVYGALTPDSSASPAGSYVNFTNIGLDTVNYGINLTGATYPWTAQNVTSSTASDQASGGYMFSATNGTSLEVLGGAVATNGWGAAALNQDSSSVLDVERVTRLNPVGSFTPPIVLASGVTTTNTFGYPCQVNIAGGIVTAITVSGTATGLTSGSFVLMPGQTISWTGSSAPTWTWFGL
jgi:hypothetical protein